MGIKHFVLVGILSALAADASVAPVWVDRTLSRWKRESVDLHNGEFCVDVSTYGLVKFVPTPREKCDTSFQKQCETLTEQVCDEVTEIQCEIVPYTECTMSMDATPYKSYEMVPKVFNKKICKEGMDVVQHTKMMPECRNVTKQNCITKWETDAEGNQVWAGNEACEPVTWRECKLVPRQVDFKVPKIECEDAEEIPYTDCVDKEKVQMTTKMECEVKHATSCKPITSTKCQSINYQECREEPQEACEEAMMKVPEQEKEHRKKCLLPDDGQASATPRGAKSLAAIGRLDAVVAAAKAQSLEAAESRREASSVQAARPLPINQRQAARQARLFQGQVSAPRVGNQRNQRRPQQQQQQQQQFVRGGGN